MTKALVKLLSGLIAGAVLLSAPFAAAQDSKATFNQEQLDQRLAPIALYPDSLLARAGRIGFCRGACSQ